MIATSSPRSIPRPHPIFAPDAIISKSKYSVPNRTFQWTAAGQLRYAMMAYTLFDEVRRIRNAFWQDSRDFCSCATFDDDRHAPAQARLRQSTCSPCRVAGNGVNSFGPGFWHRRDRLRPAQIARDHRHGRRRPVRAILLVHDGHQHNAHVVMCRVAHPLCVTVAVCLSSQGILERSLCAQTCRTNIRVIVGPNRDNLQERQRTCSPRHH